MPWPLSAYVLVLVPLINITALWLSDSRRAVPRYALFVTAREILDGLPEGIQDVCADVFEQLPIEQAMSALVVHDGLHKLYPLVEKSIETAAIKSNPHLVAGLWLYVDDLQRSHVVSQRLDDPTGAYWHAIMHRREGDFWNSKYWLRQTQRHEACAEIDGYDAERLVDMADAGSPKTVEMQRKEWAALFVWCARNAP